MAFAPNELPQSTPEVLLWEGNAEVDSRLTGQQLIGTAGTGWLQN